MSQHWFYWDIWGIGPFGWQPLYTDGPHLLTRPESEARGRAFARAHFQHPIGSVMGRCFTAVPGQQWLRCPIV